MLFLSAGASVILSLGLTSWCDTVTNNNTDPFRWVSHFGVLLSLFAKTERHFHFLTSSCAASQSVPLFLDVDTSSFYTELSLAQVRALTELRWWMTVEHFTAKRRELQILHLDSRLLFRIKSSERGWQNARFAS